MPGSTTVINNCTETISSEPCSNATFISPVASMHDAIRILHYVLGDIITFCFQTPYLFQKHVLISYTFT